MINSFCLFNTSKLSAINTNGRKIKNIACTGNFRLYPQLFVGGLMSYCVVCVSFCIVMSSILSYLMSLCSELRVVMSVTISAKKRCSVRLYLQLFVGGLMSYLRYLCFFCIEWCPTHIVLCFLFCFSSSCVPYVGSFSGLSIRDCPFGIL